MYGFLHFSIPLQWFPRPESNITVGQWTKSDRNWHVTDHAVYWSDKMTSQKRLASATSDSGNSATKKWQCNYDKNHHSLTWLKCDVDTQNKDYVAVLWCSVYREYNRKIYSMKNYSPAWITGSGNHRASNLLDHAKSDQHVMARCRISHFPNDSMARAHCELRTNCMFAVHAGRVRVRKNATQDNLA